MRFKSFYCSFELPIAEFYSYRLEDPLLLSRPLYRMLGHQLPSEKSVQISSLQSSNGEKLALLCYTQSPF